MRCVGIRTSSTLATNLSQILDFADDLDLVGRTQTAVQELYTSLTSEAGKLGLRINVDKTKYMATNKTTSQQQSTTVNIGGPDFEEVDEFQYLGVLIRADGDTLVEIKKRVLAANRCFYGLQRQLRSKLLTKETKFNIYKTLIRSVLLYGSETWPTTKSDEQLPCTFEHKVLRTILGAK